MTIIVALAAAGGLCAGGCNSLSKVGPCYATTQPTPGGLKIAKVSDTLYRGPQPQGRQAFITLRNMGIKTVLNLRTWNEDDENLAGTGLRYFHISFKPVHPEEEDVIQFLRIVTDAENQPVFVHCRQGVDRTGMMVALYRMVVEDWPKDRAVAEMKACGFNEYWEGIEDYLSKADVAQLRQKLQQAQSSPPPTQTRIQ